MFLVDLKRSTTYNLDHFSAFYYEKNCLYIGNFHGKMEIAEYKDESTCKKAFARIVTKMGDKGTGLFFVPTQLELEQ